MEETRAKNYEFMDDEAREEAKAKLDAELNELMERRREKLAEEAAELDELKAAQAQRKEERAQEMAEMAERMREAEEVHKREEEEKRAKLEEARMARILAKQKTGGTSVFDVFGKEGNPKNEVTELTPEEIAKAKTDYIKACEGKLKCEGLSSDDLRKKIKEMFNTVVKLEGLRYDLEQRQKEQEYDMKELSDREVQKARSKALAMGLDAEEAAASKHPPKVRLYSKNDRQVDHRDYGTRKDMYNKPASVKVFNVFHGSGKPPQEWKPRESEELDVLKKSFEGFKYKEVKPVEGAKPPVPVVPAKVPEKDSFEIVPLEEILAAQAAAEAQA